MFGFVIQFHVSLLAEYKMPRVQIKINITLQKSAIVYVSLVYITGK